MHENLYNMDIDDASDHDDDDEIEHVDLHACRDQPAIAGPSLKLTQTSLHCTSTHCYNYYVMIDILLEVRVSVTLNNYDYID